MRRLGVYPVSLPTKKAKAVTPAAFNIAGLIGFFERKFDKAFNVTSPEELRAIFGRRVLPSAYGWDQAQLFFDNVRGVQASLIVASHVGYDGTVIDATGSEYEVDDEQSSAEKILKIEAAFQEEIEYGISGNRTGIRIERGDRFSTAANGVGTSSDTFAILDSVAGIKVGDIVKFELTGGSTETVYKKITAVNEAAGRVEFTGAISGSTNTLADGDEVTVPGFRIHVYRKGLDGIETEEDLDLATEWLTTEADVSDYYAPNVFSGSQWIKVTVQSTTATLEEKFPAAISTTTYLAGGTDGTAPTTAAHWSRTNSLFDTLPVRFIANVETTETAIHKALETYARGRDDMPKVIPTIPEDRNEAQLTVIGNNYQRADDVLMVIAANWLKIEDPFNTAATAPARNTPNAGFVMGAWIRAIATKGIHWVPATADVPAFGVLGVVGDQFKDDYARTRLARAGINVIQEVDGAGIYLRNAFTPSTTKEFKFANGTLMREFIKISASESLQSSENTPNSINRVKADRTAVYNFMLKLWQAGSTGNVPTGETFAQSETEDGALTGPDDHIEVKADIVNNPQSEIEAGNRNIDVYFSYPAPAGSIKIGVGILLRG